MKFNDAVSGLFLAALALVVIAWSRTFPPMPGQFVGPGLFPTLIGCGMLAGAGLLILRGWNARAVVPWVALDDWIKTPRLAGHFALILGLTLAYILFSEQIGFLALAFALLAGMCAIGGVRWWVNFLSSVIGVLAVYYMFERVLRVPLPRGELFDFLPY